MSEVGNKIPIAYESQIANAATLGESLKPTQRFLLGVISVYYSSSDEFTLFINYRRNNTDAMLTHEITVGAGNDKLIKKKLPPNILVSEFSIGVKGDVCSKFELKSISVTYKIVNVGFGRT